MACMTLPLGLGVGKTFHPSLNCNKDIDPDQKKFENLEKKLRDQGYTDEAEIIKLLSLAEAGDEEGFKKEYKHYLQGGDSRERAQALRDACFKLKIVFDGEDAGKSTCGRELQKLQQKIEKYENLSPLSEKDSSILRSEGFKLLTVVLDTHGHPYEDISHGAGKKIDKIIDDSFPNTQSTPPLRYALKHRISRF